MSHNRGWNGRRPYSQNQDRRNYGHHDSSHLGYGSSFAQPYAYDYYSNGYYNPDAQPSHGFNYWRDDPYLAQNQYQPPTRTHRHTDDYYPAESSYRRQGRRRSNSPHRQYHTRAERADLPTPYIAPPSFRRRAPDTAPTPASQTKPPAPPPPPPAEPDPAYMSLSLKPSHIVDNPRASRKLLILDLNGTLLIRSQHNSRTRQKVTHEGNHTGQASRLRAVQPRPYIPAFRAYPFAPETQEWLDTMVWSSAQPHSVADMVDKVFGDAKSKLVAVWDRGSLGLSKDDYFRKAQTTKDLTKPWTLLPLGTSPAKIAVRSEADRAAEQTGLAPSVTHSAMTTLLLDDSPAKARLQPYNHVCIPEYDSSLRGKDLQRCEREKMEAKSTAALLLIPLTDNELPEEGSKAKDQKMRTRRKRKAHATPVSEKTESTDISSSSSDSNLSVVGSTSAPMQQPSIPILPTERARISSRPTETYDPTLLAVIGILDEIKKQSSVAGWIRGGGLWDLIAAVPEVAGEINATVSTSGPSAVIEDFAPPINRRAAKKLAKKELRIAKQLADKQRKGAEEAAQCHVARAAKGVVQTGNDESSIADISTGDVPSGACAQNARIWFSDKDTMTYWVGRGHSALESLGIEVAHGVTG